MKHGRALYRLLANPHYPQPRQLLRGIDNALAASCDFGDDRDEPLRRSAPSPLRSP